MEEIRDDMRKIRDYLDEQWQLTQEQVDRFSVDGMLEDVVYQVDYYAGDPFCVTANFTGTDGNETHLSLDRDGTFYPNSLVCGPDEIVAADEVEGCFGGGCDSGAKSTDAYLLDEAEVNGILRTTGYRTIATIIESPLISMPSAPCVFLTSLAVEPYLSVDVVRSLTVFSPGEARSAVQSWVGESSDSAKLLGDVRQRLARCGQFSEGAVTGSLEQIDVSNTAVVWIRSQGPEETKLSGVGVVNDSILSLEVTLPLVSHDGAVAIAEAYFGQG